MVKSQLHTLFIIFYIVPENLFAQLLSIFSRLSKKVCGLMNYCAAAKEEKNNRHLGYFDSLACPFKLCGEKQPTLISLCSNLSPLCYRSEASRRCCCRHPDDNWQRSLYCLVVDYGHVPVINCRSM